MRTPPATALLAIVGCLFSFAFHAHSVAALIVVPNSLASTEGNANNSLPFNIGSSAFGGGPLSSERYQQVYSATEFATINPTGGMISQILFRPDAGSFGAAFSSTLPSIRIDLSTTSASPDGLSMTFAANVGLDDTIVFGGPGGAALTLSSADTGPAGGPKDLDIIINLSTPFFYNPALGNLLLDVRNFGGGTTTSFDAVSVPSDGTSRVFTFTAGNVNSETGVSDSAGLVTGFTVNAVNSVPDRSSTGPLLVLALGVAIAGQLLLRRTGKAS
jgi:hypothetical protein